MKPPQTTSKRRFLVIILVVVGVLVSIFFQSSSLLYKLLSKQDTKNTIDELSQRFGTQQYYVVGTADDCVSSSPDALYNQTGSTSCDRTTAVVYFLPITLTTYPRDDAYMYVSYNDANGKDTNVVAPLQTRPAASLSFATITEYHKDADPNFIGGHWGLGYTHATLDRTRRNVDRLQTEVEKKIRDNTRLDPKAPTTLEALNNKRAPVVIYIQDRYCHSPRMFLMGGSCTLPN